MRRLGGLLVLLSASCAVPQPAPPDPGPAASLTPAAETFLDQGWTQRDRATFTTTPQGSHLMPLPWFLALRRPDRDEAFAGDQLQRYGYLPTAAPGTAAALPVGFVRDGTAADPQLGMTCAACHTGQLRDNGRAGRIDGGRANADFQAFLTGLGQAVDATLAQPDRFLAFAGAVLGPGGSKTQADRLRQDVAAWNGSYAAFMSASLPDAPWGPGRLDAFGMIFNRVTGLDLGDPGNIHKADAPVRYPFIWDAPRQDRTQWTGAAPNGTYLRGMARNTGEVFGVFGRLDPTPLPLHQALYGNSVNRAGLQTLEEKVVALRPPPWPRDAFGLDPARVSRGGEVFQAECAACHGVTPSRSVQRAWNTVVVDAGTDRRTFDNSHLMGSPGVLTGTQQPPLAGERLADPSRKVSILANAVVGSLAQAALAHDDGVQRAIQRDFAEGRLPLVGASPAPAAAVASATRGLYTAADQAPGAAYEARVLTGIWAVGPYLHNGSVPSLWELLRPAAERPRRFAVGHREFDPVHVGLQTAEAPGRQVPGSQVFVVDPANGNGNGGHEYGTALPEADRWALIEYLKTL